MKPTILPQLIRLADQHQARDEYQVGHYGWWGGGACAVGCSIHDAVAVGALPADTNPGSHEDLARVLGVPVAIPHLIDHIFEGLPRSRRPAWTPAVLRGIEAAHERGADFDAILRNHARLTLIRCLGYVGEGSEPWRVDVRRVVQYAIGTLPERWLTDAEAAGAAAEIEAQADDLLRLLHGTLATQEAS